MSHSDGHGSAIQFEGGSPDGGSPGSAPVQRSLGGGSSESYDTEFYPDCDEQVADGPVCYNIASDSENDPVMTKNVAVLPRPVAMKQRAKDADPPMRAHESASSAMPLSVGHQYNDSANDDMKEQQNLKDKLQPPVVDRTPCERVVHSVAKLESRSVASVPLAPSRPVGSTSILSVQVSQEPSVVLPVVGRRGMHRGSPGIPEETHRRYYY